MGSPKFLDSALGKSIKIELGVKFFFLFKEIMN